jgi:hypothetical protein
MPSSWHHSILKLLNTRVCSLSLITAVVIFLHYPSLKFPLYSEDYNLIYCVKTDFNLYDIFIAQFVGSKMDFNFFYRPLTQDILFYISYALFDLNSIGYRLFVIALFILCNALLYEIIFAITSRKDIALMASLCYATRVAFFHSVNWVSAGIQGWGMVCFVFFCALFYLLFRQKEKTLYYYISFIAFVFALLSKESSFVLPLLIIIVELALSKSTAKNILMRVAPFITVDLLFMIRFYIIRAQYSHGNYEVAFSAELLFRKLLFYLKSCFNSPLETAVILMVLIPGIVFLLSRKEINLIMFSVGWFFIGLLPFLLLGAGPAEKYGKYYLDISLLGFALMISTGMMYYYNTFRHTKYIVALIVCGVLIYGAALDIREKSTLRYEQQRSYRNFLAHLQSGFPAFPDRSLIYLRGDVEQIYWLLGSGDAIRLYYNNVSVYFEGIDKQLPSEYLQIYFIDVTGDTIKVSGPSKRGS